MVVVDRNPGDGPITVKVFLLYLAIPYLIGLYYSKYNLEFMRGKLDQVTTLLSFPTPQPPSWWQAFWEPVQYSEASPKVCLHRLLVKMHNGLHVKRHDQPFQNLTLVLHYNGHVEPCGRSSMDILQGLEELLLQQEGQCPLNFDKYQVEALLTRLFQHLISSCGPNNQPVDKGKEESSSSTTTTAATAKMSLYDYCDGGLEKTPILPDHESLVSIKRRGVDHDSGNGGTMSSLPCHFHSEAGIRVTTLPLFAHLARQAPTLSNDENDQTCSTVTGNDDGASVQCQARDVANDDTTTLFTRELHLYAVPAGRVFMFAAAHVGQIIPLPHIKGGDDSDKKPVHLQVLSTQPRIFDVVNFFDRRDSDDLIEGALAETRDAYRIKRSSTGSAGYHVNTKRTSESGFDTNGPTATKLKRRGMYLLGFDEYMESFTDGLQILRYNETTAYTNHLDWMDPSEDSDHDYDSSGQGGNRFATILLYMSDLGEDDGGETIFPSVAMPVQNETKHQIIKRLRESGKLEGISPNSWEESMIGECQTRFSVIPSAGRAILFYSQNPDGSKDTQSLHGACPVLAGDKWAANLWAWSTPRPGFRGHPLVKQSGQEL